MNANQEKEIIKYNFVFFFIHNDYWQAIIGPSNKYMHVYDWTFGKTALGKSISHLYWAYSLRCRIRLPFKSFFFKHMYEQRFDSGKPLCFVYLGGNPIRYDDGWCDYVRKCNPQNRQVVIHGDLISKKIHWNYEELKAKMDLCVSYDKDEARQYGIEYFQETTYTKLLPEPEKASFEYDVYFLGAAKDRLPKIHETFQYLTDKGLKCKFIVTGAPEEKQIDGIEYSKGISYKQNLEYLIKSKTVLEIIQGGSTDITTRALEAIAYRRKILTDCPLDLTDYFNDKQLSKYENPQDIDLQFLKSVYDPDDFTPKLDLNPLKRLYFIQEKLESSHDG